jgi:uncharacterized membrane protein
MMPTSGQRALAWPAAIIASGLFSLAVVGLDVKFSFRPVLLLWFFTVCPGMAWVRLLDVEDVALRWTLAIAASLLVDLLVAIPMLYFHLWSPVWALVLIAVIAGVGVSTSRMMQGSDSHSMRSLEN